MTDTLDTSLPISTSPPNPTNHTNNDINNNNKRMASDELEKNDVKERRTSIENPVDYTPLLTNLGTTSEESNNKTLKDDMTVLKDENNNNNSVTCIKDTNEDTTPATLLPTSTNLPDISLLRGHNHGAATAAVLSSLLTDEQQQHFLQTYAQASGQDLTHLTASSLAQAMVSPISVPNFNLLQQLQAGSVITALPGPPSELGLNGHHHHQQQQQHKHHMQQPVRITNDNNNQQHQDTKASSITDVNKSSTPIIHNNNENLSPSSSPDANANPAAAAAAAAAARNMSNDERRQRRLLRNRVAAKECRKKKKQYIQDLEDKITRLEEDNANLQKQLDNANDKLTLSTMQGSESYRLMKEVEELNAKLGMDHHLSGNIKPADGITPDTSLTEVVMSVVARHQQDNKPTDTQAPSPPPNDDLSSPLPTVSATKSDQDKNGIKLE